MPRCAVAWSCLAENASHSIVPDRSPLQDPISDRLAGSEERFLLLGMSDALRILVVVHACRVEDDVVRIISARRATPSERARYGARWSR